MRVPGIKFVQGRNDYDDADGLHFGIAIHNTSNNAADEGEASYATRRTDGISSHFYCDKDSVTQSLDTNDRAGHAGSSDGNQNAIAVEITGSNGMTRAWWLANVDWAELGRVLAYVITHDPDYRGFQVRRASVSEMKSNPRVKAFYGHDDMRRAWGGTTHTDPGPNFPWDRLLSAVSAALNPAPPAPPTPEDDDMFEAKDRDALTSANYRALGIYQDLDAISFKVSNGSTHVEKNVAKTARVALEQKVSAVLSALAGVDEAVAVQLRTEFDQIDAAVAAARAEIADVDDQIAARLVDPSTPDEQVAESLRQLLADRPGVLALLAQG